MDNLTQPKGKKWALAVLPIAIIAVILTFAAMRELQSVLIPLTFAWVLMAILSPLVRLLSRRLRVPETLSILISMALSIFVILQAGLLVNSLVSTFVSKYSEYATRMQDLVQHFYAILPPQAVDMLKNLNWQAGISKGVLSLSGTLISGTSTTVMVLIITAFMLIEQRDYTLKVGNAFESPERVNNVIGTITSQVSRYLILHTLISLSTGICVWIALKIIGIDFAATWGVLAFVLNYIPTIGSILASIPPLVIALVQYAPGSYLPFVEALAAILAIQMTIGNVIGPRLVGDQLNLSPVAVLVSLLFWGWLWGPAGALLATPITAAIKIICDNIAPLEPIGILLGSARPFRKARQ